MHVQAFIVHSLAQGLIVARIASEESSPVFVYSAPVAGSSLGPEVFSEMMSIIKNHHPKAEILAILDCGSEAGTAMTAMRRGIKNIHFKPRKGIKKKVEQIAEGYGVQIHPKPTNIIDLNGVPNVEIFVRSNLALKVCK